MEIRPFEPEDAFSIAQLFHDTVRTVNRRDYSLAQVSAWAPDAIDFRNWAEVCNDRQTYVAVIEGEIVGFAELEPNGHIDCFYCHKNYQRRGVGRQLYAAIEANAIHLHLTRLFTESSITARPFFEQMGFAIVREQQVMRRGQIFTNYAMQKFLNPIESQN